MEVLDGETQLIEPPPQFAAQKLFAATGSHGPFLSVVEAAVASLAWTRLISSLDATLFLEPVDLANQFLVRHGVLVRSVCIVASPRIRPWMKGAGICVIVHICTTSINLREARLAMSAEVASGVAAPLATRSRVVSLRCPAALPV